MDEYLLLILDSQNRFLLYTQQNMQSDYFITYQLWILHLHKLLLPISVVPVISTFPGLDHRSRGLRCVLLSRRVFLPAERAHERNESRYRTDAGASDEPNDGPKAVLRSD